MHRRHPADDDPGLIEAFLRRAARSESARVAGLQAAAQAAVQAAAQIEDLEFMAANDETTAGAAARLGMSPLSLQRILSKDRWNRPDLWHALRRNEALHLGTLEETG